MYSKRGYPKSILYGSLPTLYCTENGQLPSVTLLDFQLVDSWPNPNTNHMIPTITFELNVYIIAT